MFIKLGFPIIFVLLENPIKEGNSHFSFVTEAEVHLSAKELPRCLPRCLLLDFTRNDYRRKGKKSSQRE